MILLFLLSVTTLTSAQTVVISGTSATLGTSHILNCALMGSSATDFEYQWRIGGSIEQPFSSSNQFVIFNVGVSDARNDYSCDVMVTGTGPMYSGTASLNVALPDFSVTFTRNNPTNPTIPYVGSNISYTCQIFFPGNALEDFTRNVEISGPSGTPLDSTGDRVVVSETTQDGNSFMRTLYFSPLSAEDVGEYRCTSTLQPATPNPLVTNRIQSATWTINVIALQLRVELTHVTRVTDPLSLTCSATVMIRNDPAPLNIEFSWLHSVNSGPQEELNPDLYTNSRVFGSAKTSNLTVHTEKPGNHTYTCRVNLNVSPAPDVIMDEDSTILELEVVGLGTGNENTRISIVGTGIGIGFSVLVLAIFFLCGVIAAWWKCSRKPTIKADLVREEPLDIYMAGTTDTQLYAEIRDPYSTNPTRNVTVPATDPTSHQYEDVKEVSKSGTDYQLTQNVAYGMTK